MKPVNSLARPDGRTVRVVRLERRLAAAIGLLSLSGCASTQLGAQYVDPQFPQQALRGATILVVCEAPEPAIKLICESQISSQLTQLGARPLTDSTLVNPPPGHEPPPSHEPPAGHYLPAAQAAGARAVFSTTLMPDYWRASPMSSFSIGIGGWGGSGGYYGGSGVGGGVGVTMPVGGAAQGVPGLAAIGSIIDVASGRVMWTAKATTPPAADASTQVAEVTKALAEAARQTGLF